MVSDKVKQRIKFSIAIVVIAVVIAFAIFSVIKYDVEGEKDVPFKVGKVIIISSAELSDYDDSAQSDDVTEQGSTSDVVQNSTSNETSTDAAPNETPESAAVQQKYIWNKRVIQTNDVYIYIDKSDTYKENEVIDEVSIENVQILKDVDLGKIQLYMPNNLDDALYKYTNDLLVSSSLTYNGAAVDNSKALEIGNQGGCVCISFANVGLNNYMSNDDQQIEQGAGVLQKMNIVDDNLTFKVAFDVVITVKNMKYKTNVSLDMPVSGLVGQKESHKEITDFDGLIYKRF